MLLLMHLSLLMVAFVFQFIELTSGASRRRILNGLAFLWLFLVAVIFLRFGWKAGFASGVMSWVYVSALRPLAARLAARAMSTDLDGGGVYPGLPSSDLLKLSRVLGRHSSLEEMLRELRSDVSARESALDSLVAMVAAQTSTASIIVRFGMTEDTLKDHYRRLCQLGAGQWAGAHFAAASALAYPASLEFILSAPQQGVSEAEVSYQVIKYFQAGAPFRTLSRAPK